MSGDGQQYDPGTSGVDDADLVDYLHGELDAGGRARVQQLVSESPDAAARLDQLHNREERLRTLLSRLDPDELSVRRSAGAVQRTMERSRRDSSRAFHLVRAAAVIVVLGAAALAVEPVRAALADGVRSVARALGLADGTTPSTPVGPAAPAVATVRTTVAWNGTVFTVELPAGGGSIDARTAAVPGATITHGTDVPIVVTPAGVRISAANATVSLVLPTGTVLRVVHAGRATDHPLSAQPVRIER